jgi:hypothetical protein
MRPPPLLLGTALLFWGWRIDMLWAGALCGALIELPHAVKGRWDFSDKEFNRLWDVCTVIFVSVAGYLRVNEEMTSGAYKFFQWMPLVFYLMALGLVFSTRDLVPMKAFSWFLRRKGAERGDRGIAFAWIYVVVCLVAAGATNERDLWFFIGITACAGWSLWSIRPRRVPDWAWCALFAAIAFTAFAAQARMQEVQDYFESKASELFVHFGKRRFDPNESRTALGSIGELKQSSRVVMKVAAEGGPLPERLRAATFSRYDGTTWRGWGRNFEAVAVEPDLTTWTLIKSPRVTSGARITQRANRAAEILAVPHGTTQLRELTAGSVSTNTLGAIRAEGNPGLLNFVALGGVESFDIPPRAHDLDHEQEFKTLNTVAAELNIDHLPDEEKPAALIAFFERNFRYTTYQAARALELHPNTPLAEFLLKTRAGHCEHFATATVQLLRYYQIPARYAVGYAVQSNERDDDSCLVRERDGHAWALAHIGGRWIEVDSTPPDWSDQEKQEFPFYQDIKDSWGRFLFGFLEWRWLGDWGFFQLAAPWLIAPLIGFLAWRIFGRKMSTRKRPLRETRPWPGADSEFYALERQLARAGLARQDSETASTWSNRVAAEAPVVSELLAGILRLHHRYRFDPAGITLHERERLREIVRDCAAKL